MNRFFQKLPLVIAGIIGLLVIILAIMPAHFDSNEIADPHIVVSAESGDLTQDDLEAVKREAETALKFIPPILGVEVTKTVKINFADDGICNAGEGIVSVPIAHVKDRSAAIIHEVTHVIARHENNSFFSEGLAVYFQDRFGHFKSFPNYSIPLDELLRTQKEPLIPLAALKEDNEIFQEVGSEERRLAYIEAGSFIHFLVVRYGEQKIAELHKSSSLNYKDIYGKTFAELETEWQHYLWEETS